MKPRTITNQDGIFTLDSSGFYIPFEEPEQRTSLRWMLWWAAIIVALIGVGGWVVWG